MEENNLPQTQISLTSLLLCLRPEEFFLRLHGDITGGFGSLEKQAAAACLLANSADKQHWHAKEREGVWTVMSSVGPGDAHKTPSECVEVHNVPAVNMFGRKTSSTTK